MRTHLHYPLEREHSVAHYIVYGKDGGVSSGFGGKGGGGTAQVLNLATGKYESLDSPSIAGGTYHPRASATPSVPRSTGTPVVRVRAPRRQASPAPTPAPKYNAQQIKVNSAPISQIKATYRTPSKGKNYTAKALMAGTPKGWIAAQGPRATTDLAAPTIMGAPSNPAYAPQGSTAMGAGIGEIAQQDWGMNAAAQAQIALLMASQQQNVQAARESEVSRGMGRSGIALGVEANVNRLGALDAQNAMAQSAAEQGRLNQEVAIASAGNVLDRETANQNSRDRNSELAVSYDNLKGRLALDTEMANADTQLAYSQFNEAKRAAAEAEALARTAADREYQTNALKMNQDDRQFGADLRFKYAGLDESSKQFRDQLALNKTDSNRGYQMDRLGYNQGERQFAFNGAFNYDQMAATQRQAAADLAFRQSQMAATQRQADSDLAFRQSQVLAGGAGTQQSVQSSFEKDLPSNMQWLISNGETVGAETAVAMLKAQYPGIDLSKYPEVLALVGPQKPSLGGR